MHQVLKDIVAALDELAVSVTNASQSDSTMSELWGWNFPPLNRHDLASCATALSDRINENEIDDIPSDLLEKLGAIPNRITVFKGHSLQNLYSRNGNQVVVNYISLIEWIELTLKPLFGWQTLQDNKALPNHLARRLRSIQAELSDIEPNMDQLQSQIELINKATEAAETLPADLESLQDARKKVNKFSTEAAELFGEITTYQREVERTLKTILDKKVEADKLVSQCEEAYKITTTKGLAGAFDQRAMKLSISMWIWVLGLLVALIAGASIGANRFEVVNKALFDQKDSGHVWIQIFLSVLSLGAPIWFAWIATKQITQRFKLSEDYAYKSTISKAYEGYRREAARIDSEFETRLFDSALTRLEEAPLRFMENENHGSPWHELVNSTQFQKALETMPELKTKFYKITKNKDKRTSSSNRSKELVNPEE